MSVHDVPTEYGNDLSQGFLFEDADGVEYENQYPTASYGQTSTIGDYIVSRFYELDGEAMLDQYLYVCSVVNELSRAIAKNYAPDYACKIATLCDEYLTEHGFLKENVWDNMFIGYEYVKLKPIDPPLPKKGDAETL